MKQRKNKQKKKKALVIVLIILAVLAVIATGCFLYLTPDQAAKEQYNEEAAVLTQEITDRRLSQLSEATAGIVASTQDGTPSAGDENSDPDEQPAEPKPEEPVPPTPVDTEVLKANLLAVYDQILLDMQDDGMELIDNLIAQAKADYKQLKADKKSNPASVSKLATEYMSKGSALENQMDSSFESITQAMEEQMRAFGIDPEPVINEYHNQYTTIKEQRQKSLIDKALKAVR